MLLRVGGGAIAVAAVGGAITAAVLANGGSHGSQATGALPLQAAAAAGSAGATAPPWPRPGDTTARAAAAGLIVGASEGTAMHFHVHLDVYVNGMPAAVPADLGIGSAGLAELHTHDATGVLHIEAPAANTRYVLGQLFDEWNVRLDQTQLGGLTDSAGNRLSAYVNGKQVTGNPATIDLKPHAEIVLAYGPGGSPAKLPSSYAFPAGE